MPGLHLGRFSKTYCSAELKRLKNLIRKLTVPVVGLGLGAISNTENHNYFVNPHCASWHSMPCWLSGSSFVVSLKKELVTAISFMLLLILLLLYSVF